jgi:translation initiation factor 6
VKKIEDTLGVEAASMEISGYKTAGMMVVATNKGWAANNRISAEEAQEFEKIFKAKGLNCTINGGTPMVGLGIVANSKSAIVGEDTSGFELGRIEQALDLTE